MVSIVEQLVVGVVFLTFLVDKSSSINCYQCSGTNSSARHQFECREFLDSYSLLEPESCDTVYGARFCVKQVGRFEGRPISCYHCSSADSMDCGDAMIGMGAIEPVECTDVFEAQYCIKSISLDGGVATRRFCSALDLGNYCNYVRQPGDQLDFRTCIYTCSTDSCNPAARPVVNRFVGLALVCALLLPFFM